MEVKNLSVFDREFTGSSASRRIRRLGNIPAVVYNNEGPSFPVQMVSKDFIKLASQSYSSQVFKLSSENKNLDGKSVIVKDVQIEAITSKVEHVDLLALSDSKPVVIRIPIRPVGEAVGVKTEGGILSVMAHTIKVSCLPANIPLALEYDVSSLHLSQSIHASDLELPEGATLASDPKETVATVVGSRASRLMAQESSAAE